MAFVPRLQLFPGFVKKNGIGTALKDQDTPQGVMYQTGLAFLGAHHSLTSLSQFTVRALHPAARLKLGDLLLCLRLYPHFVLMGSLQSVKQVMLVGPKHQIACVRSGRASPQVQPQRVARRVARPTQTPTLAALERLVVESWANLLSCSGMVEEP